MSPSNFCQTERTGRFLSELMRPHPFVKLNAIEGLGGGAFTFSIFSGIIPLFLQKHLLTLPDIPWYTPTTTGDVHICN